MSRDLIEITPMPPPAAAQQFDLRATAYNSRQQTLSRLRSVLDTCGGFVLDGRCSTPSQLTLLFEVPRRSVFDLYSGLLGAELDLSRDSHQSLTGLCALRRHSLQGGNVSVLLEVIFLDEAKPDDLWTALGLA